jgi:hypothetical protein
VPARVAVLGVAAIPAVVFAVLGARRGASYRMIPGPVGLAGRFALGDGVCGRGARGAEGAGEAFDIKGLGSCVDGVGAGVGVMWQEWRARVLLEGLQQARRNARGARC